MRDKNVPISRPFIIEKSLQFAKALGYDEFRGSNGWLEKFKRRHGIMAKAISGESKDVDDNDNENWIPEILSNILKDYKPENIFNADETALFFQCWPQKTFTFEKEKMLWRKTKQSKINCHVRCKYDWTSEIDTIVIGRSNNPRCFKGAKSLEADYDFNQTCWIKLSEICEKWVQKLDKLMIAECRKIALVFDNCPSHPKGKQPKTEKGYSFLLATKHYIKTAANG
ncbi:Tigger transposable element-derived protein 4 [Araneus ventricosus]|uniref:Tigger transposable element-derived protein 4 n=1 Tax=Araneus ventricosus TaxID=182803 RepID=A0A4Y2KHY2_ARAVE|nr:Tigger transposable element-derived protein 4 [Araneus ventricosus]